MPDPTAPMPTVGLLVPPQWFALPFARRQALVARAAAGLDHLAVADHISFYVGTGFDGLAHAAALLAMQPDLTVHTAVYQLVHRHPVDAGAALVLLHPSKGCFDVAAFDDELQQLPVVVS